MENLCQRGCVIDSVHLTAKITLYCSSQIIHLWTVVIRPNLTSL